MSFESYKILGFCPTSKKIVFYYNNNKKNTISINLLSSFPNYCPVSKDHYIELSTGDFVHIKDGASQLYGLRGPTFGHINDSDGNIYRPATQLELDCYETKYPDSDNGKLYQYLKKNYVEA